MSELKLTKQLNLINVVRGLITSLVIILFFALPFINFHHFFTPEIEKVPKSLMTCLDRYKRLSQETREEICLNEGAVSRYRERLFDERFNSEPQFNSFVYLGWGFLVLIAAGLYLSGRKQSKQLASEKDPIEKMQTRATYCEKCEGKLDSDSKFCSKCGARTDN